MGSPNLEKEILPLGEHGELLGLGGLEGEGLVADYVDALGKEGFSHGIVLGVGRHDDDEMDSIGTKRLLGCHSLAIGIEPILCQAEGPARLQGFI